MNKKYFIELAGTVAFLYSLLLSEGNPIIISIVYFAVSMIGEGITTGYFNPLGSFLMFFIGRITFEDFMYNIATQLIGMGCVAITFLPIKTYIDLAS